MTRRQRMGGVRALLALAALSGLPCPALAYHGRIVDAGGKPVPHAFVTLADQVARTDALGDFNMDGHADNLGIRAYGHARLTLDLSGKSGELGSVALPSLRPKALYLSTYGVASTTLRQSALRLVDGTELNALVIDVKGDRGFIGFKSHVPLAAEIGAQKLILVRDMKALVDELHVRGIYLIARIVVFKDNYLATARPDWAVHTTDGNIWRDRESLAWVDPYRQEVRDYNVAVAVEAARAGFDEIQFDYVRFPDTKTPVFSQPSTQANRVRAIADFLAQARKALIPYNVFLSADVFGYILWNVDDTGIGQRLPDIMESVDYLSPMLYPSGFQFGIPGYRNPVMAPFQIVSLSLKRAAERTGADPLRFRPWLQSFKDYAFDRRHFTASEIRAQIDAAQGFGSNGWMLWNPRNVYSPDGLQDGH